MYMRIPVATAFAVLARPPRVVAAFVLFAALMGFALPAVAAERYEHGLLWRIEGGARRQVTFSGPCTLPTRG